MALTRARYPAHAKNVASVRTRWSNPRGRSGCAAIFALFAELLIESRAAAEEIERIAVGGHFEGRGLLGRSRLRVGPCALFELGAVHASGLGVKDAPSTTRAAASMGAGLRGVLTPGVFYADFEAFPLGVVF